LTRSWRTRSSPSSRVRQRAHGAARRCTASRRRSGLASGPPASLGTLPQSRAGTLQLAPAPWMPPGVAASRRAKSGPGTVHAPGPTPHLPHPTATTTTPLHPTHATPTPTPGAEVQMDVIEAGPEPPARPRITTRYLTKYEKARVLGTRALQISMNAPVMTDVGDETGEAVDSVVWRGQRLHPPTWGYHCARRQRSSIAHTLAFASSHKSAINRWGAERCRFARCCRF
jgi:hypothetical protein